MGPNNSGSGLTDLNSGAGLSPDAEPDAGAEIPVANSKLVAARLAVAQGELVLELDNLTQLAGNVSFDAIVDNPEALYFTPHPTTVALGPGERLRLPLAQSEIHGLDLTTHEWMSVLVSPAVLLSDGRRGGEPVSVFVDHGQLGPARDVASSGKTIGFTSLEAPTASEPRSTAFDICFANVVTFAGSDEPDLDYFAARTQVQPARGMCVSYAAPDGSKRSFTLNAEGCATALPRVPGNWTFTLALCGADWPIAGLSWNTQRADGTTPTKSIVVNVTSSNMFPVLLGVSMPLNDGRLQAADAVLIQTFERLTALRGIPSEPQSLNIKWNENDGSLYDRSTRTIFLDADGARRRRTVAHHLGHWVQYSWGSRADTWVDYSFCTPGTPIGTNCPPPAYDDGCRRSPDGVGESSHALDSIEWQSTAHVEGFANFIVATAYNSLDWPQDCFLPDVYDDPLYDDPEIVRNCERMGMTLFLGARNGGPCLELETAYVLASVEGDWTKMYWDYFSEESNDLGQYLTAESQITDWRAAERLDTMYQQMDADLYERIFRAAVGNIFNGNVH